MEGIKIFRLLSLTILLIPLMTTQSFAKEENIIAGETRFETALEISKTWKTSKEVILVNSTATSDMLCATTLASQKHCPILLTYENTIGKTTIKEIERLETEKIYIIGGEKVIKPNIEKELKNMNINTQRISGDDRYETCVKIADTIKKSNKVEKIEMGKPVQPRRHDLGVAHARRARSRLQLLLRRRRRRHLLRRQALHAHQGSRAPCAVSCAPWSPHGADPEILVESRPHVGSNRLPKILMAQRADLEARGATYRLVRRGHRSARCSTGGSAACAAHRGASWSATRSCSPSATRRVSLYELLHRRGVALEAKAFAVGARVEHPQPLIDRIQYGRAPAIPRLPAAFYHVTATVPTPDAGERGVYSFCMCPGGWIVDSSTEQGALCVNGMSLKRRDSPFANAALVVSVEPRDYLGRFGDGPLAGIELQRAIERRAFELGGGGFVAPAQRLSDFLGAPSVERAARRRAIARASSAATCAPRCRRSSATRSSGALSRFQRTHARLRRRRRAARRRRDPHQLAGAHPPRRARSSHRRTAASIPPAKGAGYAGGIVSAAVDGMRVADAVLLHLGAG